MSANKDVFLTQMKKKFDDLNYRWNIERNKLEAKAQIESAEVAKKFKEKQEDLRQLRTDMHDKIKDLETAGENAWDDVKDGAEEAWKALSTAFDRASSHFK